LDCFVRACLNSTSSTSKALRVHQEPCFLSACLVHLPVHSHPPLVDSVSCLFACPDRPNLTLPLLAILQDFLFVSTSTLLEGSRIQTSRDSLLAMHAVGASSPGHKYHQMLGRIPDKNIDSWWWACRQMLRSGQKHDSVMCYNLLSDFGRRRLWAFNWRKYPMICRRCHDDLAGGVDGVRGRDQRLPRSPCRHALQGD
jgi:hypothetical protein